MPKLVLWQLTGSPPSWAVIVMAELLGLELELKTIEFHNLEHKTPEFRKLNPMGTVPVIKDGDFVISESHTIMKYLLEKYGNAKQKALYPSDLEQRALVDQAMYFDTGVAFIRVKNIALPSVFEGLDGLTPRLIKDTEDVYDIVEMYLNGRDFVAASTFTLADISLGCTVHALDNFYALDAKKFPRTFAWMERLRAMPNFSKVVLPGAQTLGVFVKSCWEKNKK
ncbi:glutathione S-transferase 1-like [Pectinophora gossypiella]|uniref:glutathione S-transferase 1-like n=1 Tax=Pectinophora gossypiella TaxID=13191 RepID=UPI00214DF469|nr:glutathione S-transferase 1-like [Pectinophora gossypiella]XP_049875205.1 glutathione S-transferase 1-like [Pectinophora gossypiella]XP_049875206.1 glutathione S-transferase 1-like [Pectinophora gossypiella]XP_049875207.1 glutathione S-transferase 1-like [Pectinophora gossypiella]